MNPPEVKSGSESTPASQLTKFEKFKQNLKNIPARIKSVAKPQPFRAFTPVFKPADNEQQTSETPEDLQNFINNGLNLVKVGRYKDAVDYFHDTKTADKFGVENSTQAMSIIRMKPPTPDEIDGIIADLMLRSHADDRTGGKYKVEMKLPQVIFTVDALKKYGTDMHIELPEQIYHATALTHSEEWLHALQYIKNEPLAGIDDPEIDVALYWQQQGVPLLPQFLEVYGRKKALEEFSGSSKVEQN